MRGMGGRGFLCVGVPMGAMNERDNSREVEVCQKRRQNTRQVLKNVASRYLLNIL